MRFDKNIKIPFTHQCKKDDKQASNFALLTVVFKWHHGSDGVNPADIRRWLQLQAFSPSLPHPLTDQSSHAYLDRLAAMPSSALVTCVSVCLTALCRHRPHCWFRHVGEGTAFKCCDCVSDRLRPTDRRSAWKFHAPGAQVTRNIRPLLRQLTQLLGGGGWWGCYTAGLSKQHGCTSWPRRKRCRSDPKPVSS